VGKKTSITVTRIKCNKASEAGHDEIFVTFQADGGFRTRLPRFVGRQSMATGTPGTSTTPRSFTTICRSCSSSPILFTS